MPVWKNGPIFGDCVPEFCVPIKLLIHEQQVMAVGCLDCSDVFL